jgi:hypothetical protein
MLESFKKFVILYALANSVATTLHLLSYTYEIGRLVYTGSEAVYKKVYYSPDEGEEGET